MRDYLAEYLPYKSNSRYILDLKKRIPDEDLRHYLIGLATALDLYCRKSKKDYSAKIIERLKEARDLSGMFGQIIKDLNGSLQAEEMIQNLEKRLTQAKDESEVVENSALRKISDEKTYLINFGERVETRLQGKSYEASYFIYKEEMKRALEFIEKQTLSKEDRKKEKIRTMDHGRAKIFDKEGEIIRGAMIFEIKKI